MRRGPRFPRQLQRQRGRGALGRGAYVGSYCDADRSRPASGCPRYLGLVEIRIGAESGQHCRAPPSLGSGGNTRRFCVSANGQSVLEHASIILGNLLLGVDSGSDPFTRLASSWFFLSCSRSSSVSAKRTTVLGRHFDLKERGDSTFMGSEPPFENGFLASSCWQVRFGASPLPLSAAGSEAAAAAAAVAAATDKDFPVFSVSLCAFEDDDDDDPRLDPDFPMGTTRF
ncbi:hypothetical protein DFJ73DRAFT_80505 [Zopfochytrium polystomum]|nr:hypothetical protein DFJ73DRAFT_80505 [Zopfochytrium polystomum]